jgi:DNA-directed RNA polymerase subunit beta'
VLEYFISTHGARKGLADTALKTADAGYLTRKLCDVAMDVIITDEDDPSREGIWKFAIYEGDEEIVPLRERIIGRCLAQEVRNPIDLDEVVVAAGELVTKEKAARIDELGIERVYVMSPLTHAKRRTVFRPRPMGSTRPPIRWSRSVPRSGSSQPSRSVSPAPS